MTGIGLFLRKAGFVSEKFSKDLSSFVLTALIPALIFSSVKNGPEFSLSAIASCGVVILCSILTMVISLGVGQIACKAAGGAGMGRILRYSATFTNFSFMGLPIIEGLFGDQGVFYYVFFMIPVRIFYYSLSEILVTPAEARKKGKTAGEYARGILLNPALVSVFLGILFWVTGWKVPDVLDYCIRTCGSMCSPMGLILGGVMLGGYEVRRLLHVKYLAAPVLRLVIMPFIFLIVTRGLLAIGVEKLICDMMVIYSALPIPTLLAAYVMRYDPDPDNQFSSIGAIVISILLCTVTVPLWYLAVQAL